MQIPRGHSPELDVVRLLAFSLVFLNHVLPDSPDLAVSDALRGFAAYFYNVVRACSFGVSLFFVLSAFLICELLLRERDRTQTVRIEAFYSRRILRIWPLGIPWILKHATRIVLYAICAILILASSLLLGRFGILRVAGVAIWTNAVVQFQCFAGGALLCLGLRGRLPSLSLPQRTTLFIVGLASWFIACQIIHVQFQDSAQNPGSWALIGGYSLATTGSVMLLAALLGLKPNLLPAWMIYLGRISYGLYIFHPLGVRSRLSYRSQIPLP